MLHNISNIGKKILQAKTVARVTAVDLWLPSVKRGKPLWRGSWGAAAADDDGHDIDGDDGGDDNDGGDDHHDSDKDDNDDGKWEHHYDGDCEVLTVIVIAASVYIVSIFLFHH